MKKARATKARVEPQLRAEFKPRTEGQADYLRILTDNDITVVTGCAGTGKSYIAIGLACQYLLEGRYDFLIIARPNVQAAEDMGFLPGDIMDKFDPYVEQAIKNMKRFLGPQTYEKFITEGVIQFKPLGFMRGTDFDNTFMILEEAQNCTEKQLTMFVTRIGKNSKILINGDIEQDDLNGNSGLEHVMFKINRAGPPIGFGTAHLTEADVQRNPLIRTWLQIMKE